MKTIYWSSLIAFILLSCGAAKESGCGHLSVTKERKLRQTYNLPIDWRFYRESDTSAKWFFEINPNLFLTKFDSLGKAKTKFRVSLQIHNHQFGGKTLFFDEKEYSLVDTEPILDSMRLALPITKSIYYEIRVEDLNKYTFQSYEGFWERTTEFIPEDVLLVSREANRVLTRSFIYSGSIAIRTSSTTDTFQVSRYDSYQSPATSMWEMKNNPLYLNPEPSEEKLLSLLDLENEVNSCNQESYFRIRPQNGAMISSFDFTKLNRRDEKTIEPLVYFAREEALTYATWVKFWGNASLDEPQKAEKLIQEFNRRVEYANCFFSAHKEGWKTDRGMVYLLFGPADRVISDIRGEVWSYGFTNSVQREFVFARNPSGLHKNDFVLERNIGYREIEFAAIQRWKNGWVRYSLETN